MLRIGRPVVICLASVLGFMVIWAATNHSPKILLWSIFTGLLLATTSYMGVYAATQLRSQIWVRTSRAPVEWLAAVVVVLLLEAVIFSLRRLFVPREGTVPIPHFEARVIIVYAIVSLALVPTALLLRQFYRELANGKALALCHQRALLVMSPNSYDSSLAVSTA
jgi:hypothetical protein